MDKNKIFNLVQSDIKKIDEQLGTRNGSGELWRNLSAQYAYLLPDITKAIKPTGKVSVGFEEFDYRSELKQLRSVLSTWILINEEDLEVKGSYVSNESKRLLNEKIPSTTEVELRNLIHESKNYIKKKNFDEKKIGLEKIWDAFERLKTIKGSDKKKSTNHLISIVSGDDKDILRLLNKEFADLTEIGNQYSIRHSETTQKKLPDNRFVEYLYFRMLSLVSLVLESVEDM